MTKNKKLKNKKRYLGNPFTVAFLPVLAAAGLTLGATSLTMKATTSEALKAHDIDVETPGGEWTLKVYKEDGITPITKAVKGETVIFKAFEPQHKSNQDKPTAICINGEATYKLDKNYQAKVLVTFIEKMIVEFLYPEEGDQHSVTFDLGYQPEDPEKPQTYTLTVIHNRFIESPFTPVRENYEFDGWYEGSSKFDFEHTAITDDHTLVAHWNDGQARIPHDISLTQPSGTGKSCWKLSSTHTKAALGDEVTFTAENESATITHWFPRAVNINGQLFELTKETDTKYTATVTIPFKVSMTASVEFVDEPYDTFIVSFDAKGADKPVLSQIRSKYDKVKEPEKPTKKGGYTFEGWFYLKDTVETKWDFVNDQVLNNVNLYAKWTAETYTVTFNAEDAEPATQSFDNKQYGDIITTGVTTPVKTDPTGAIIYKFLGWKKEGSEDLGIQPVEGSDVYNAVWEETAAKYTVTFDLNGGTATAAPEQQVVEYGNYAQKPDDEHTPTLDEYHDKAVWYADGETEPFNFENTRITSNILLHARYAPKSYKINFNNWDGTPFIDEQSVEYNHLPTMPTDTPTKTIEGYDSVFAGWKNENPTKVDKGVVPATEDATYVAQFNDIPKTYIVKVDLHGGKGDIPTAIPVAYNNTFSIDDPTPALDGQLFNGWYLDELHQIKFTPGVDKVTKDITIHAQWRPKNIEPEKLKLLYNASWKWDCEGLKNSEDCPESLSIQDQYSDESHTTKSDISSVYGFAGLTKLCEVFLPANCESISNYAFDGCSNLRYIGTDNLTVLGKNSLSGTALTKYVISANNYIFYDYAFANCTKLTSVTFENYSASAQEIEFHNAESLFDGCTNLETVYLPKRIKLAETTEYTAFPKNMFNNCPKLKTINFEGTMAEWKTITKDEKWRGEKPTITKIVCSDGTIEL